MMEYTKLVSEFLGTESKVLFLTDNILMIDFDDLHEIWDGVTDHDVSTFKTHTST